MTGTALDPGTDLLHGLETLPGIGLDSLTARAALMTRIDRKYLVPGPLARQLITELADRALVLDIDGRRRFRYRSTYYDTADLTAFRAAAGRRRRKYKVRRRDYLDTGASFLEVKTNTGLGASRKQRIPVHAEELGAAHRAFVDEALTTAGCPVPTAPLHPVLGTRYDRSTILLASEATRLTLDAQLTWESSPVGPSRALHELVVIETKTAHRPGTADHYLWDHGHRPVRLSKYATGMALLDPSLGANRWHRTLQRIRTDQDPTTRSIR